MSFDMNKFSLQGKVAWITGASYGIGFAIATAFSAAGARIVFNDITPAHVERGLASYREQGIDATGYVCDVTDEAAVQALVKRIEAEVGTIDILVNNAGIIKRIPMLDMSAEDFRKVVDVDLNAPFICAKAVIPGMMKKGHGKIINICSMMSELGRETVSAYAAAKGGLKMLAPSTANITSSATASAPATSPRPRPRPSGNGSPTAAAIPSTSSSWPRPRRPAGAPPRISWVRPCSWPPTPPTSSTATSSTWTAVSWPTSASSRKV